MVVPTRRLHLYMFANHVEAQILRFLDIIGQSLIGRCGIEPIRPPTLVEWTKMEDGQAIQSEAHNAAVISLRAETTHCKITGDFINHFSSAQHLDFHIIQERMVRRPSQKVLRHVDLNGLSIDGFGRSDRLTFKGHLNLVEIILGRIGEIHLHANRSLVIIGCSDYVPDIVLWHILQPYRLPDTRHSSVENAARLEHLLAMRNITVVGRVPNTNNHRVLFALKGLRDIKSKRSVPTCMRPHLDVVHPYIRHPVDGTEMQQDATIFPVVWNGKSLLIPQGFLRSHFFLNTRKR